MNLRNYNAKVFIENKQLLGCYIIWVCVGVIAGCICKTADIIPSPGDSTSGVNKEVAHHKVLLAWYWMFFQLVV